MKYPKNKATFLKLIKFGKEIITICKEAKTTPILYGSLAYFEYTKDKNTVVNDLDFYVPEHSFEKIIKILNHKKIKYNYSEKWHTLQISRGKLRVELDSSEYWHSGPKQFKNYDFNGLKVKILSLEGLKYIYKKAANISDKPKKNLKKLNALRKIISFSLYHK